MDHPNPTDMAEEFNAHDGTTPMQPQRAPAEPNKAISGGRARAPLTTPAETRLAT